MSARIRISAYIALIDTRSARMIPQRAEIARMHAELCSGISDPNRIAILYALSECPNNVSTLTERLRLPQSTVSRHLRILRNSGLVNYHRLGREVVYELSDDRVIEALELLRLVLNDRINSHSQLINDEWR
jgi:ArsR family transcriptional regulator